MLFFFSLGAFLVLVVFFFFFLMIRRPPRSTLFPTRRSSDLGSLRERLKVTGPLGEPVSGELGWLDARSEEHTSELQSLAYLVCRLLLEKKKKKYFVRVQHREECRNQSAVRDDRRLAQRKSRR